MDSERTTMLISFCPFLEEMYPQLGLASTHSILLVLILYMTAWGWLLIEEMFLSWIVLIDYEA